MRMLKICGGSLALMLLASAVAVAQNTAPSAAVSSEAGPTTTRAISRTQAGADSSLRLGAGDSVEISVYNIPELNTKARVSSDGDLYLPLVDYVHVEGLTIEDAEVAIERRLEQGGFVRSPHVQLLITDYASEGASVLGEVTRPGVYPILGEQRLFDVISAAGGLTDRAGKSITVTHRAQPEKPVSVALSRNLDDHPESNVPVFAGDTIVAHRADVVYVVGEVARPSGFLMDNNGHLSVLQALALAGGTTPVAKLSGARIIRKGPSGLSEVQVPLKKLLAAKAADLPLEAEDILFVPTSTRKIVAGQTASAATQLATQVGIIAVRP